MLRKIYEELVLIRKELQMIRKRTEFLDESISEKSLIRITRDSKHTTWQSLFM